MHSVLGKAEGEGKLWHGHVTAVTVAPECRRLGLATKLMNILEETTEKVYVSMSPFQFSILTEGLECAFGGGLLLAKSMAVWCRHDAYFVDLFVRKSNELAISMYTKLGYTTYRRVIGYYSGQEDALGATLPTLAQPACL